MKKALGLEKAPFSLGSLRESGATQHVRARRNLGVLQFRSHGENAKSMNHYIWMGSSALAYA